MIRSKEIDTSEWRILFEIGDYIYVPTEINNYVTVMENSDLLNNYNKKYLGISDNLNIHEELQLDENLTTELQLGKEIWTYERESYETDEREFEDKESIIKIESNKEHKGLKRKFEEIGEQIFEAKKESETDETKDLEEMESKKPKTKKQKKKKHNHDGQGPKRKRQRKQRKNRRQNNIKQERETKEDIKKEIKKEVKQEIKQEYSNIKIKLEPYK